jgi:hypothetical protein
MGITVTESAHALLADWESFYVVLGSSSAVLIGLQFIVVTLMADLSHRAEYESVSAFGTPTITHLSGAFLISAIMLAPWTSLTTVSTALALAGLGGLGYSALVLNHALHQTAYDPEGEDWIWYVVLPGVAHAVLTLAALFLHATEQVPLFVIAAAALSLLFVAIHNAWDTVTYLVLLGSEDDAPKGE